ncbi:MAG TPA: DUF5995 family protein [Chloroflexota bacterium]|nr:DUF5995 family protein [Chloroflexota bacterium]
MTDALTGPPITSIDELIERLVAIDAALPLTDGLSCFNRMYLLVTRAVQQRVSSGVFGDPLWMAALDVVLGNLYLAAIRASVQQPDRTPRAWLALLERRADTRIAPLQFALAGLSAHINRDLPVAVVATSEQLQTTLASGAHHADYDQVNAVLATVEPAVRQSFSDGFLTAADHVVPGLQDVVANFNMVKARETAWANAETLWLLSRISQPAATDFLDGLDHLVGFAGRGLLLPLLITAP